MTSLVAIGAGIAALNRYWSRCRYWNCNIKGNRRYRKTAGSRRKDHKDITYLVVPLPKVLLFSVWL